MGWLVKTAGFLMALAMVAVGVFSSSGSAGAHGATSNPASRVYVCRFAQPNNSMCASVWSANSQALYDWMEVNIGDVGGAHQARIPDGKLCSAGRDKYAALDTPSAAWPVTDMMAGANGRYRVEYVATAPHSTEYFRLYLTKPGFDAANSPLGWDDLELVYDSGPTSAQASYAFDVDLPARTGHHILYTVWQRSDSPEAFYSCSDVRLSSGGDVNPATVAPVTTAAPATSSPTTSKPATSSPGSKPTTSAKPTASTSPSSAKPSTSNPSSTSTTPSSSTTSATDATTSSTGPSSTDDPEAASVTMVAPEATDGQDDGGGNGDSTDLGVEAGSDQELEGAIGSIVESEADSGPNAQRLIVGALLAIGLVATAGVAWLALGPSRYRY